MSDPKMQYGWVCPVCGRGLSPQTMVCPCKDTEPLFFVGDDGKTKLIKPTNQPPFYAVSDWRYINPTPTTKGDY